jgi:hypothetical protein
VGANITSLSEICVFIVLILLMEGMSWLKIKGTCDTVKPRMFISL